MAFQGKATFCDGFAVAPDGCRLAYHLDGNAASPDKVLLIMGFACCRNYWKPQVSGAFRIADMSMQVCTFDNRGVGLSDRPIGSYSTRRLAGDCLAIMEHVGWLPREHASGSSSTGAQAPTSYTPPQGGVRIHVVGWSMGGMIAQEVGLMLLDRGKAATTLTFACTHSGGWRFLPPLSSLGLILHLLTAVTRRQRIERVLPLHYHQEFLEQPASVTPVVFDHLSPSMHTSPHASHTSPHATPLTEKDYLADAYADRAPFKGSILEQMSGLIGHVIATTLHYVSAHQLRRLGATVTHPPVPRVPARRQPSDSAAGVALGAQPHSLTPPRCLVMTAKEDILVPAQHSLDLARALQGNCELVEFEKNGHMVNLECYQAFNVLVRQHIQRACGVREDDADVALRRRVLLHARCRRYEGPELNALNESQGSAVIFRVILGWVMRYLVILPLAFALEVAAALWTKTLPLRATIASLSAFVSSYLARRRTDVARAKAAMWRRLDVLRRR